VKLLRFSQAGEESARFGVLIGDRIADLTTLFASEPCLSDMDRYLAGLPHSAEQLRLRLATWSDDGTSVDLQAVRLRAPLARATTLVDFAVAPAHLRNSARTLMRHEMPALLAPLAAWIAARRYARPPALEDLRCYFGGGQAFVDPGETVGWPDYSQYVDPEAELAVVTGAIPAGASLEAVRAAIAGYTILNDVSARDVQYPEMKTGTLGFMRTKHFDRAFGLGPVLVTLDELGDERRLSVEVRIGDRLRWQGTTADYAHAASDVLFALTRWCALPAGSVVGLGTVPGCCGLDSDQWPLPGETVDMHFSGIGRLRHVLGRPAGTIAPKSRWKHRQDWPSALLPN